MIDQDKRMIFPGACRLLLANEFEDGHNVRFHSHEGAELIFVESGSCTVEMNSASFAGQPGSLFFIPKGVPHNQINFGMVRDIYCVYRAEQAWENRSGVIDFHRDYLLEEWLSHLILLAERFEFDQGSVLLAALLMRIGRLEKEEQSFGRDDPAGIARRFLESHYGDIDLSLERTARVAGVSASHLKALFRERFGAGVMHYAASLRMRRAEQLLRNPYLSIAEAAWRCGYSDPDYFARAFRLAHGVSPSTFRADGRWNTEQGADSP